MKSKEGISVKVLRKESILGPRPRPRPQHDQKIEKKTWVVGEIAEVFDTNRWRVGKVAKVLRNEHLVVKFFGSIQLKEFHISSLRIRGEVPKRSRINARKKTTSVPESEIETTVVLLSDECSVIDSCSLKGSTVREPVVENGSRSSDAESSFPALTRREFKVGRDPIHHLELQAYRSTVQALYASGPLSWEQESMLTNLRLSLHISNDEHLHQLRHLLSAQIL